jgi:anti-anti-sigma factor
MGYLNDQTERGFEQLLSEIADGNCRVVIDCSDLVHISSIGFGALLAIAAEYRRSGGDLRFACLQASLARALTLAFGSFFRLYDRPLDAVRSFGTVAAG